MSRQGTSSPTPVPAPKHSTRKQKNKKQAKQKLNSGGGVVVACKTRTQGYTTQCTHPRGCSFAQQAVPPAVWSRPHTQRHPRSTTRFPHRTHVWRRHWHGTTQARNGSYTWRRHPDTARMLLDLVSGFRRVCIAQLSHSTHPSRQSMSESCRPNERTCPWHNAQPLFRCLTPPQWHYPERQAPHMPNTPTPSHSTPPSPCCMCEPQSPHSRRIRRCTRHCSSIRHPRSFVSRACSHRARRRLGTPDPCRSMTHPLWSTSERRRRRRQRCLARTRSW